MRLVAQSNNVSTTSSCLAGAILILPCAQQVSELYGTRAEKRQSRADSQYVVDSKRIDEADLHRHFMRERPDRRP